MGFKTVYVVVNDSQPPHIFYDNAIWVTAHICDQAHENVGDTVCNGLDAANLQGWGSWDIVCQSGDIICSNRIFFILESHFKWLRKMNSMAEEIGFFQVFTTLCAFSICICRGIADFFNHLVAI